MALSGADHPTDPSGCRVGAVLLTVDPDATEPPFRQLRGQLVEAVRRGALTPGTRVPPVRTLAARVGVAANTAAKVYRELEETGVLESRGRSGTFVAHPDSRSAAVQRAAEEFVSVAAAAGVDVRQACAAVEQAFTRLPD